MPHTLVIAEKPSVGRDLARVLGCRDKQEGYLQGEAWRVTWAVGHLVSLCEPEEIAEKFKKWRMADLPMLPEVIPLKVLPKTKKQFQLIKHLMAEADDIVCATDAGREGELIFRYIYRMAGCKKSVRRLWISSMTDEAIREGFASLKPGEAYDSLYESARCRSEADWLVGMNASRAFTLRYDALLSVGRVQTPTLQILVKRRQAIEAFDSKPYWVIAADFGDYSGVYVDPDTQEKRVYDEARAQAIAGEVRQKLAQVAEVSSEPKQEWPPQLYDLTSLQRDANSTLGFTAQRTLKVAQSLYETHKLLTYPRTDSRYLPNDMVDRTRKAIQTLPAPFQALSAPLLEGPLPKLKHVFNDAKVSDHHAILPTGKTADLAKLPADERAIFELVARRLLATFYPPHRYDAHRILTDCEKHRFLSVGRTVTQIGWKAVYADQLDEEKTKKTVEDAEQTLPSLTVGDERTVRKATVKAEKTKPPKPHTDASLLAAMEHADREVEDDELRAAMQRSGLGTPATRAAVIERLIQVGYAERKGRALNATDKGVSLIAVVPPEIAQPEMTGRWEKALNDIVDGTMASERFLQGIRNLSAHLVQAAREGDAQVVFERDPARGGKRGKAAGQATLEVPCPVCGKGQVAENSKAFYCTQWREGCAFKLWKNACERQGGPALTAKLVTQLLEKKTLRGSSGTLAYGPQGLSFTPQARTQAAVPKAE